MSADVSELKLLTAAFCGSKTKSYGYYYCRTNECHYKNKNIPYEKIHNAFIELLKSATPHNNLIEEAKTIFKEEWDKKWQTLREHRHRWGIEIENLNEKINKCIDQMLESEDKLLKDALNQRIADFSKRREMLLQKISEYQNYKNNFDTVFEKIVTLIKDPAGIWVSGDKEVKQMIQRIVFS